MSRARRLCVVVACCISTGWLAAAGQTPPARYDDIGARLMRGEQVRRMLQAARDQETRTVADQVRLCEVAAPPFHEADRARLLAELFRAAGLRTVRTDAAGNIIGERPGTMPALPLVVFSAHLDTVFSADTPVTVTRKGSQLHGPGIADNCRGLAVLLGLVRALDSAGVRTRAGLGLVGTVGEEGLGDLRGVRALFDVSLAGRVASFVAIDGGGVGLTTVGVGSLRFRVAFRGPGGHSYGGFGLPNPIHALGRAIASLSALDLPREPRATVSVGRVGGGTSINAIPSEAWMEVDLRAQDHAALGRLRARLTRAVGRALEEENRGAAPSGALTVETERVGNRPTGRVTPSSAIVVAAASVTRALHLPVAFSDGSTDANWPMSLGVPALAIGGGGRATGGHTVGEAFDTTNAWLGTARAALLAVALTGQ